MSIPGDGERRRGKSHKWDDEHRDEHQEGTAEPEVPPTTGPKMIGRGGRRAPSRLRTILMIGSAASDHMRAAGTATATITHAASVLSNAACHFAKTRARSSTGRVATNGAIP